MRSGHEAEGTLHHLGQLFSRTLAPFLFLLSGKKLFPGVSVELTEYKLRAFNILARVGEVRLLRE